MTKRNHLHNVYPDRKAEYITKTNFQAKQIEQALIAMTPQEFAEWREDYYLNLMVSPFGIDADGFDIAPFGMSVEGVPKLLPEDL